MIKSKSAWGIISITLLFSWSSIASINVKVEEAVNVGAFPIGVGSAVKLTSDDKKLSGPSLFLGNIVKADGSPSYQMYLNQKQKKVFYIESSQFKTNIQLQKLLDPYEQAGGTCAAYAIDQFMIQTHLSGFSGTGKLAQALESEEGRTHLLADSINQYYLNLNHRFSTRGILDGFGKDFGFKCKVLKEKSYESLKEKMLTQLSSGSPVIVSFSIGPKMVKSPFVLEMVDQKNGELDGRLWIPRKIGERNSGGHSIVAAGAFVFNQQQYLVMLDSDWSEPRIWEMDAFLNQKTDFADIEFVSCK